jgi:hypothetical protein
MGVVVKVDSQKMFCFVINGDIAIATGDGQYKFPVPKWLGNRVIDYVEACCGGQSTSGDVTITLYRFNTGSNGDILSTGMTIQANEYSSQNGTAGVIDASFDDVVGGETVIGVNVDAAGTGCKWIHIWLGFK